jgi:hypothetical protein
MANRTQIIATVPDATDFGQLPPEVQELFGLLEIAPPVAWTMSGTRTYNGRRAIRLQGRPSGAALNLLIAMFNAVASSGWELEAAQPFKLTKVYDTTDPENPVFVGYEGAYKKLPLSFLDYVADQYDENDNVLPRPTGPVVLTSGAGADPWQWEGAG